MQILASALPGFRDLRAPLVAGYMWLLFAWLSIDPNLDDPPKKGPAAALVDLSHELNRIEIAVAVGVVAYLLGSVSQSLSTGLRFAWASSRLGRAIGGFRLRPEEQVDVIQQKGERKLHGAAIGKRLSPEDFDTLSGELSKRADEARKESYRELELPAILLVGDKAELFAEVDRLRAEGELRLAVVPPLLALMVLLSADGSMWWLAMGPAILVLFVQGIRRETDSRKSIADALRRGLIQSSSAARLDRWVEEALPS